MLRWQIDIQSHKAGNIHKNAYGLRRWALANSRYEPSHLPLEEEPHIPIEDINITDIGTEFFQDVRESYKEDKNIHISSSLLDKDCKYPFLGNALDE
ncbi:hypothetical protein O181_129068, partial [Austropuccinia psidii MF-1]|nr:hypothetical protein [Austropuccinia psidii MF-1]